ncbi:MAG: sensor histidine kinase [Dechloromonas sp.]|nr:sensor histidine kinase [Dechloromonas sp.]
MDLRRRLVGYLGALLTGLFLMALLVNFYSLRSDMDAEVAASERLARILIEASSLDQQQPPDEAVARLRTLINQAPLRHLRIAADQPDSPPSVTSISRLADLLGIAPPAGAVEQVRHGRQTLYISPNPASEIEERLGDTVRLCITLLLFSGATLLVAWWSADRALAPVRELEAGLQRLANGEPDPALPAFDLREFRQVAGAIDQLALALNTSRAAQKQLSRQLIQVQEDERRTLARELHDETGQTLAAIGVTAAFLERNAETLDSRRIVECARELRRDVRTTGEQLRSMLKRLRPHGLDAEGVAGALRELIASWQQRAASIDFRLELPARLPTLNEEQALVLYRVVQEALTNVVRHSAARHCVVHIEPEAGLLRLSIDDDGQGLPASGEIRRGGLLGIEERLEMVNGTLELQPGPTAGLQLRIVLPLNDEKGETA